MPLIIPANSITGGYEVANSLRFDQASSDNLTRTTSGGSYRKMTFSCWSKKSDLDEMCLLGFSNGSSNPQMFVKWDAGDTIAVGQYTGVYDMRVRSTAVYRDVSAWYHIVASIDTEQATASNRVKIYINGNQLTSFSIETYPSQNSDLKMNGNVSTCSISDLYNGYGFQQYGGYLAEVCYIDGQQLDPTSFGEFDADTGIWKPIDVSGLTFGTNGFYLDFENSGSLGADVSGNGNNFTVNNLTSIDQTTDTPTNNYCTGNPLDINTGVTNTFSEGNLKVYTTGITRSTIGVSAGKWYCEVKCVSTTSWNGITDVSQYINNEYTTNSVALYIAGATLYVSGVNQGSGGYGSAWSANDIMNLALDLDSGTKKLYFGKNGNWWNGSSFGASSPTTGVTLTNNITYVFSCGTGAGGDTNEWNFGNPPFTISSGNSDANGYGNFEYSVPSGYYALNTKNLSEFG